MNDAQAVFTLFFAISWGIVSNVLPRWKPFHYAMWSYPDFQQPTRRILLAFILLNILPWVSFALVLFCLRARAPGLEKWNLGAYILLIFRTIFPGLAPFGFYRIWIAVIQSWPTLFYAEKQDLVPEPFRTANGSTAVQVEPDIETLRLRLPGAGKNFCFGVIYVAFGLFALFIPGAG
jgi:hypothetical protein